MLTVIVTDEEDSWELEKKRQEIARHKLRGGCLTDLSRGGLRLNEGERPYEDE